MYTIFGEITQTFIKTTLSKNNTRVLTLIMFYETRGDNPKKAFRVFSCVFYSIIKNYVCIDYLSCLYIKIGEITLGSIGGSKYVDKRFNIILVIEIPDLFINLMSYRGFLKNINAVVILKFPKWMLEYYSQKDLLFGNAILIIWKTSERF